MSPTLCFNNTLLLLNIILSVPYDLNVSSKYLENHLMLTNITHINNETMQLFHNFKSVLTNDNAAQMFDELYLLHKDVKILMSNYFLDIFILFFCGVMFAGIMFVVCDAKHLGIFVMLLGFILMMFITFYKHSFFHQIQYHYPNFNCYDFNYTIYEIKSNL